MEDKCPLKYQETEYNCGEVAFTNALSYLLTRNEFNPIFLKKVQETCLDTVFNGKQYEKGTSVLALSYLVKWFKANSDSLVSGSIVDYGAVNLSEPIIKRNFNEYNGCAIVPVFLEGIEHYVLVTQIDYNEGLAYLFDSWYLPEDFDIPFDDIKVTLDEPFKYNRVVSLDRLETFGNSDYNRINTPEFKGIILLRRYF